MKKTALLATVFSFITSLAFAQAVSVSIPGTASTASEIKLKGDIIDNLCAGSQKPEVLSEFIKTHTKECALLPQCVASGYSIFADGKLNKLDKASNAKIEEFLKKADSKLQVVVVAKKAGDVLSIVSIENQK